MSKSMPYATHDGTLQIGSIAIPCAVLEDGRRVLTQEGFLHAIGRARKAKGGQGASVDERPAFLAANNLQPFISKELAESTAAVVFTPLTGGRAYGYVAELLPMVCNVYLSARDAGALVAGQEHIAQACDILVRGLAKVGVVALVDEATGYQDERGRDELQKLLALYIAEELLPWAKTFPDEFYRQIFRLRNWKWSPIGTQRPRVVGKLTNEIVYDRLPNGVLDELRQLNPAAKDGRRSHKHFQFLTDDIGQPHLRNHIVGVLALMKASPSWRSFKLLLDRAYPVPGSQNELEFEEDV